jgi:23S rRNA pseudouridine2605 synthase
MCAACDLTVKRLRRVQEHSLALGDLPVGQWRYLTEQEIAALKEE